MLFSAICVALTVLSVAYADDLGSNNTEISKDFRSAQFGIVNLQKINYKHLPPVCDSVPTATCELEAAGDLATAISQHERRIDICGGHGWARHAVLGEGRVAPVWFMSTPCGSPVAAKFARLPSALEHVSRDCFILRKLAHRVNDPDCRGCFPKYFYHSNYTGVCYSELVHAVPMTDFLNHVNATQPDILLETVKLAFHQGLSLLRILQEEGVKHQDLSFRNVLVRVSERSMVPPFRVLFLDFGGSYVSELGQTIAALKGVLGNHGHPDAFAWPCAFLGHLYFEKPCGEITFGGDFDLGREGTFRHLLLEMMQHVTLEHYHNKTSLLDYSMFQNRARSVNSF
jgi:hypothetical protein